MPGHVVVQPVVGRDTDRTIVEGGWPAEGPSELDGSRGFLVQAQDGLVGAHEVTRVPDHGPEDVSRETLVGDLQEYVVESVTLIVFALEVREELSELDGAGQLMADVLECARGQAITGTGTDREPELHPANGHCPLSRAGSR